MGSTASVISEIVPDVKERLPDVQPPLEVDDPDSARFRLFDSITTFLKTVSGGQPIVLMLETSIGRTSRLCYCWSSWHGRSVTQG